MQIVDQRSRLEQLLSRPAPATAPRWPARLAGRLADELAAARAARRQPPPSGVLVLSIGNLRVGGTGKTPLVQSLALDLQARGVADGAILLRGHGSAASGPLAVDPDDPAAADEARLLAAAVRAGGWTVVQARRRSAGVAWLRRERPRLRLLVLEDGFQTAGVGRHLDALILDTWTEDGGFITARTGAVLPFGPYRETARGAARAHVWLLETAAPPPHPAAGLGGGEAPRTILCFQRRHALHVPPDRPEGLIALAHDPEVAWGLVAGLARPEPFEAAARELLRREPVLAVRCCDHCAYDRGQVAAILAEGRQAGVAAWLTTAKDWVKLQALWPAGAPVLLVRQKVTWTGNKTLPALVEERLQRMSAPGGLPD